MNGRGRPIQCGGVIIQRDWYLYTGDEKYLKAQKDYLLGLIDFIITKIDRNNYEALDGFRFLDWPSTENTKGSSFWSASHA